LFFFNFKKLNIFFELQNIYVGKKKDENMREEKVKKIVQKKANKSVKVVALTKS
jgi:hypothetical protein